MSFDAGGIAGSDWARCFRLSISSLIEGYSAAAGAEVTRADLTGEAIRLGRLLTELQPKQEVEPEVIGLLSLMLLHESRRAARTSPTGELILLENQNRSLWNREQIAEGVALLEKAQKSRRFGAYTLQAAIAAVHAEAESVAATNWGQIVALYDQLARIQPSPVVQLNRAVAIAMRDGPEAGLTQIDAVLEDGELADYYLAHSARTDMYRRLGKTAEAGSAYEKALALTQQELDSVNFGRTDSPVGIKRLVRIRCGYEIKIAKRCRFSVSPTTTGRESDQFRFPERTGNESMGNTTTETKEKKLCHSIWSLVTSPTTSTRPP